MATINWLPAEKRYKYPHLSPADVAIWERYLDNYLASLGQVAYDVRVGTGTDPGDEFDQNMRDMAIKLTQLRIDVLNHIGFFYEIIEVKKDPGVGAIGQLLSYFDLFTRDFPDLLPLRKVLICNRITDDLITLCTDFNIKYQVI